MAAASFSIEHREIGPAAAPYIIAELGINHGGDAELAHRMMDAAAKAGADALKLQTFQTGKFLSRSSAYYDVLHAAELPAEALARLVAQAKALKVTLFSAVFDEASADIWEKMGAPAYKIASGDLIHIPLLRHVARFGKPMVVSTGGATTDEIDTALQAIRGVAPAIPVALLHCVSSYPTQAEQANLACMSSMRRQFGTPVGFSDHTMGTAVAVAAAALGAELIEKHFTLDRAMPGPDHALSANPVDLASLIEGTRLAHAAIGRAEKAPVEASDFIPQIRRSLTAARAIAAGETVTQQMLEVKRPGTGIAPADRDRVVGCRVKAAIAADTTLTWDMLEG